MTDTIKQTDLRQVPSWMMGVISRTSHLNRKSPGMAIPGRRGVTGYAGKPPGFMVIKIPAKVEKPDNRQTGNKAARAMSDGTVWRD